MDRGDECFSLQKELAKINSLDDFGDIDYANERVNPLGLCEDMPFSQTVTLKPSQEISQSNPLFASSSSSNSNYHYKVSEIRGGGGGGVGGGGHDHPRC